VDKNGGVYLIFNHENSFSWHWLNLNYAALDGKKKRLNDRMGNPTA